VPKTAQKARLGKQKTFSTFAPARRRRDVRIEESWSIVQAESMVGGTIFHREMIPREISRALVLNLSGETSGAKTPPRRSLPLTEPSLLSRGTRTLFFCGAVFFAPVGAVASAVERDLREEQFGGQATLGEVSGDPLLRRFG
jgi:hypothetical protein